MKKNKDLGKITFGKSRKAPPMVEVDVHFDKKCGDNLYKYGLKELKKDRKAVINYIIVRAITWFVKGKKCQP
jgi:hypothetical protein